MSNTTKFTMTKPDALRGFTLFTTRAFLAIIAVMLVAIMPTEEELKWN